MGCGASRSMASTDFPWLDGNYKGTGYLEAVLIKGDTVTNDEYPEVVMTFSHGAFGEADEEVAKATGQKISNIEIKYSTLGIDVVEHGVLSKDGKNFTIKTMMGIWNLEWITAEEAIRIANDGDPIDAPPSHYKLEPERQGRLLWITGAPGLGKSTTAQILSRDHGHVYYEGDCFFMARNPYIHPDVENPSTAILDQRKLLGEEAKMRRELGSAADAQVESKMAEKKWSDFSVMESCYALMCKDILRERKRMGGHWAIATTLIDRQIRDYVRSQLGPELQIVVLDMSLEEQMKRTRERSKGEESSVEICKAIYEISDPAQEDEPNTLALMVTPDMKPEDVVKKVLQLIN